MNQLVPTSPNLLRPWLMWTAGFLAFPIAGLAGTAAAGRVDSPVAALAGGLVTGAVLGAGQSLASNRRLDPRRWILATALGWDLAYSSAPRPSGSVPRSPTWRQWAPSPA